jgi:hypothetical protein
MSEKHTCEHKAWSSRFGNQRCAYNASLQHKGKWYCGLHHPPTVKAKRDKRDAAKREKWAAQDARAAKDREVGAAEKRVVEAALKLEFFRNELEGWPLVGPDGLSAFEAARDALRKLKGEPHGA